MTTENNDIFDDEFDYELALRNINNSLEPKTETQKKIKLLQKEIEKIEDEKLLIALEKKLKYELKDFEESNNGTKERKNKILRYLGLTCFSLSAICIFIILMHKAIVFLHL